MMSTVLYVVSAVTGALFMGGSLWLAFVATKPTQGRRSADQGAEFAVELKWFKIKSSYPMLGMAMLGAALIVYPMYVLSSSGMQPVDVSGQIIIEPIEAMDDVIIKLMLGPWDVPKDSDGKLSSTVLPDTKKYRVEVRAPGRATLVKTVTLSGTGVVDIGELRIAPPVVDYVPVPLSVTPQSGEAQP